MEINWKAIILLLGVLAVGLGLGYYFAPEKVKEVEKIVVKEHRDVVTVVKERPDGTKETVITDRTTVDTDKTKEREVTRDKKDWILTAGAINDELAFTNPKYFGLVQKRILGEIYVGGMLTTSGEFGLALTYRF